MNLKEEDYLAHYGILRKSGRYPWGSGGNKLKRSQTFLDTYAELKRQGMSDKDICAGFHEDDFPFTTTHLRNLKTIANAEVKQDRYNQYRRLQEKGWSDSAIGRRFGVNESSVRTLTAKGREEKLGSLEATAAALRRAIDEKTHLDVGAGVEVHMGVSRDKLNSAITMLKEEGYKMHYLSQRGAGTDNETSIKALSKPGAKFPKKDEIGYITDHSKDEGKTFVHIEEPVSISSKRIHVRYAEDGGTDADGVIYVRPNVDDVSIGPNAYAQVRIKVDNSHYLKGMAMYKEDLPPGVDLMFNTNKSNTGSKLDSMKELKSDPENPFGSIVRQFHGPSGKLSAMNIVGHKETAGVEGGWGEWSKSLASQVLAKQNHGLAQRQLDMMFERKKNDFDEVSKLANPAVKRKLLESLADDIDSTAVKLKGAPLPGQSTHVILPVNSMKKDEVYAPNYPDGTSVALIRYPHGGTFEIPILAVNNKNREAKKLLGVTPEDAIGIHHTVAERLSGADFDGDTVLVIPNNQGRIKSTAALEGLRGFEPKASFPKYDGMRTIDGGTYDAASGKVKYPKKADGTERKPTANAQTEMGKITNLITDMTTRGANTTELARAIRHSMVVIDAEKHVLDYKGSYQANGIPALKKKYQLTSDGKTGASTLISRAGSKVHGIPQRRLRRPSEGGPIDPKTGEKRYINTDKTYRNRAGEDVLVTETSKRLAETTDAHKLVSEANTKMETVFADHANRMKALANTIRKETLTLPEIKTNESAKHTYKNEVESLKLHLKEVKRNAPRERQAQLIADSIVRLKKQDNPGMDKADQKKEEYRAIAVARRRTGSKRDRLVLTQGQWDAIQAGAVSKTMVDDILKIADLERVKELATPRTARVMSSKQMGRARQMLLDGYSKADIAAQLGVLMSTLNANLK